MISFIVPAYNEEVELPGTLRAIRDAAEVAQCEFEIVVVDDGSTDGTATVAQSFGARVVPIRARHIAAARNSGAKAARGDIFVFVDADTHIQAVHVLGLQAALAAGCSGGAARLSTDREIPRWGRIFFQVFTVVYFGLKLGAGAFLFTTRENFRAVGGFDETYFAGEEVHFTLALRRLGRFEILREPAYTSGRKLRLYSGRQTFLQAIAVTFGGGRRRLDLWYGGAREARSARPSSHVET